MLSLIFRFFLLYLIILNCRCEDDNRAQDGLLSSPEYLEGNQVIFLEHGTVANQIGFVHVKMVYRLGDVKNTVENALIRLNTIIEEEKSYIDLQNALAETGTSPVALGKMNGKIGGSYLTAVENMQQRVSDYYQSFCDMLIGLPNSAEENLASQHLMHRQQRSVAEMDEEEIVRIRRGAPVVAAAFALGGSIMAFLSLAQIQDLYRKFGGLQEKHNRLVDITSAHDKALSGLRIDMNVMRDIVINLNQRNGVIANSMSDRLIDYISHIEDRIQGAIDSAQQQRLSFRAINGHTLLKLWAYLHEVAAKEGFDIMLDHAMDLYQMEASYIYDYRTMEFILFVHVPMIPPGNKLTLYRFIPFPVVHSEMANTTMIPYVGEKDYLALNGEGEYRLMSTVDINACEKRGTLYLCSGRNVLYNDLSNTCLGSFYRKNETGVQKKCKFEFSEPEVLVFSSGFRSWLIYAPEPGIATVKCRNAVSAFPPIVIRTQTRLKIKEGCSVRFKRAHLSADENVEESMRIHHVDWAGGKDLFNGLNAVFLEQKRKELGNLGFVEPTAPRNLDDLKSHEDFSGFSIINMIVFACIGVLLFFIVAGAAYFFLKFRKEKNSQRNWLANSLNRRDEEVVRKVTNSTLEVIEKKVGEVKATPLSAKVKKLAPSAPPAESGSGVLRNRKIGKKLGMVSLNCATTVCKTAEARELAKMYPRLGENAKTKCLLDKNIAERFKEHKFHCTYHDNQEGCTGIFLALKPASKLSLEDILHDQINN